MDIINEKEMKGLEFDTPVGSVPDLPLCLGVLKHRAPLIGQGAHLPAPKKKLRWIFAVYMSDLIQL